MLRPGRQRELAPTKAIGPVHEEGRGDRGLPEPAPAGNLRAGQNHGAWVWEEAPTGGLATGVPLPRRVAGDGAGAAGGAPGV